MDISLNLGTLLEYGLSPNEYIVLYLLKTKNIDNFSFDYSKTIDKLIEKEIINTQWDIIVDLPKNMFGDNNLVDDIEIYWEEFKNTYPKLDGVRRLHDSPSKCKDKYLKVLRKDVKLHQEILKGLKAEIELRSVAEERSEFFPAPKLMSTYINNKSWEGYQDVDLNNPDNVKQTDNKKII